MYFNYFGLFLNKRIQLFKKTIFNKKTLLVDKIVL